MPERDALAQASQAWSAGRYAEAAGIYRAVLKRDPSNFDALYLLGTVLLQTGRQAEADECLRKAAALAPAVADCGHMDGLLRQQNRYSALTSAITRYQEYKKLQATDAFIVSYPKCGRTWLRLLLGKLLQQQFGFAEDQRLLELRALTAALPGVPTVDISHDDYPHWKPADAVERTKQRYRARKVVFLMRDPRDTLVSYYFQYTHRGDRKLANDAAFDGTISDFIRHRIGGIDSLAAFYNAWAEQRSAPAGFLALRYEDLHAEPVNALRRLSAFLGFPEAGEETLQRAVSYCSFDNMRRMEKENALQSARLAAPDRNDPESFKVRRGKVAGYRDYLGEADLRFLDSKIAGLDDMYESYKRPL
jgi:hypothetical protein